MAAHARRGAVRTTELFYELIVALVTALVVLIPMTYALVLAVRAVLFATGLADYADPEHFLITGTSGVLIGSAIVALLSAKGTLKRLAQDGPASIAACRWTTATPLPSPRYRAAGYGKLSRSMRVMESRRARRSRR